MPTCCPHRGFRLRATDGCPCYKTWGSCTEGYGWSRRPGLDLCSSPPPATTRPYRLPECAWSPWPCTACASRYCSPCHSRRRRDSRRLARQHWPRRPAYEPTRAGFVACGSPLPRGWTVSPKGQAWQRSATTCAAQGAETSSQHEIRGEARWRHLLGRTCTPPKLALGERQGCAPPWVTPAPATRGRTAISALGLGRNPGSPTIPNLSLASGSLPAPPRDPTSPRRRPDRAGAGARKGGA